MRPMTRGARVVVLETEERGEIVGLLKPWGELIVRLEHGRIDGSDDRFYAPHELEVM